MKMADHGYRPANGQFRQRSADVVIVAVDLDTTGSDGGLMAPMQEPDCRDLRADAAAVSGGRRLQQA